MGKLSTVLCVSLLAASAMIGTHAAATPGSRGPGLAPASDFNGDGWGDLAVGVTGENGVGAVQVFYGDATQLDPANDSIILESSVGLTPGTADSFGGALAAGNFNADSFTDLAVGVRGRASSGGDQAAGLVVVLYGSSSGLQTSTASFLSQGGASASDPDDTPEAVDIFGDALAVGRFDQGSTDDLAVASPAEDVGAKDQSGAVSVFYGGAHGLTASGHLFLTQNTPGIADSSQDGDAFGSGLAAGDFGRNAREDLAIGAGGEDINGVNSVGVVHVVYGSDAGITTSGDDFFRQGVGGVPGISTTTDFGAALGAGDFGNDAREDLAIGAPGALGGGGEFVVLYGSPNGLETANAQRFDQDNDGAPSSVEPGDNYGSFFTAGDFGNGARADLAIGVPREDAGSLQESGVVIVLYGSPNGLTPTGAQLWQQGANGVPGAREADDFFGAAVSAGRLGPGPRAALAVGAPDDSVGSIQFAGVVNILYGSSGGLSATGAQIFGQNGAGVAGVAEQGDRFGDSLA